MWRWIEDIVDFILGGWEYVFSLTFWAIFVGIALSIAVASQFESERMGWLVAAIVFIIYLSAIRFIRGGNDDCEDEDDECEL